MAYVVSQRSVACLVVLIYFYYIFTKTELNNITMRLLRGLSRGLPSLWKPESALTKQVRTSLLAPATSPLNHRKMLSTYTMRSAVMSSHMHITVLFSVKAVCSVVVSPSSATLWSFVNNASGIAPRYTCITTAVMLPVSRAASMAGGTVVVIFVSQLFCVCTVVTGVGCLQLTTVVSAWQRRAIQAQTTPHNLKVYMRTGTLLIRCRSVQPSERANQCHRFVGGADSFNAFGRAIFRKTY